MADDKPKLAKYSWKVETNISDDDLQSYLETYCENGWDVVSILPNGREGTSGNRRYLCVYRMEKKP